MPSFSLFTAADFRLTPSVVQVGVPTEVTITPTGDNTKFEDGYEYTLEIWPAEQTTVRLNECNIRRLTLTPKEGRLIFTETFEREQQYTLKLILPEELRYYHNPYYHPPYRTVKRPKHGSLQHPVLWLYAVEKDLYPLRVYKGDLHMHTCESDGRESMAGLFSNLKKAGMDFAALTDHYRYPSSVQVRELFSDAPDCFTFLPGEEVHVPSEYIHTVSVGASASVNAYYYEHREECEARIRELSETLEIPEGIDRYNYAARYWVGERIHEFGGYAVLTHPYWIWNAVYFMQPEITRELFERGNHDFFELLNGTCGAETNMLQTAFYWEERAGGYDMPIVGSSDIHVSDRDDERLPTDAFTLVLAEDRTPEGIFRAISEHRSVAVEHYAEDKNFRVHGDLRLVKYCNFLLGNYYPRYRELCYPLGTLMKEYGMTQNAELKRLMGELQQRCEDYTAAFFGGK